MLHRNVDSIKVVRFSYKIFVGNSLIILIPFNLISDRNFYYNEKRKSKCKLIFTISKAIFITLNLGILNKFSCKIVHIVNDYKKYCHIVDFKFVL